ncbi:MAG TPA: transporter [Aquabacterium sp.]|nr:transporter [Aquabacterium sp.]
MSLSRVVLGVVLAIISSSALAQSNGDGSEAVRNALGKQEGDVDQNDLLKETLTSKDKQYSMLKRGKVNATYDLTYTYIGQQQIDAQFDSTTSQLTLFKIDNTRSHTFTHTVSVDYGLLDNVTGTASASLVDRYSESTSFTGLSHSLGDMTLGARWQPFELKRDAPTVTASGTVRLPTGRSPYRTDASKNLATGSGTTAFTGGLNFSKVVDPVALFGSANVTYSLAATHLNQYRSGKTLTEVKPGPSIGYGVGFAYALSYDISVNFALQHSISWASTLRFTDGTKYRTSLQNSAVMNYGMGIRFSPTFTMNVTLGVGLTSDSPDFTLGVNVPLNF